MHLVKQKQCTASYKNEDNLITSRKFRFLSCKILQKESTNINTICIVHSALKVAYQLSRNKIADVSTL